jgi:hypothetical protein
MTAIISGQAAIWSYPLAAGDVEDNIQYGKRRPLADTPEWSFGESGGSFTIPFHTDSGDPN